MFMSAYMSLFEGNAVILNIYSEVDKPKEFIRILTFAFGIVIITCASFGWLGYQTFGTSIRSVVMLNLPPLETSKIGRAHV